ncbi:MAG: electron transfer flavoprotein subunit beta/FixA family protein [Nitrospiraceae bacterium]|nr:electron transfer flavoprotein subunit beta/FixA family protein [Nitrospiraceae bacterium]MDA8324656.1 electron transfer flavoprotein subunit beta/FixA family protein [Nitrospiraceae bacterium]
MRIAVCIKQVPDTAEVKINRETGTLVREGVPSIINPYDMHAIEAALGLRDALGGKVTAITMGPPQAEAALREAISMGVDDGLLVTGREFAGADTLATSRALSGAIRAIGADLIVCGKQAIDGDTAQVGPEVAEFLDIPHVSYVRKIIEAEIDHEARGSIKVERLMDEGVDVVQAELPALITVVRELNTPRLPSLRGKINAKKTEIKKLSAAEIGLTPEVVGFNGSPTQVKKIFTPAPRCGRRVLEGGLEEQVEALVKELMEKKCL